MYSKMWAASGVPYPDAARPPDHARSRAPRRETADPHQPAVRVAAAARASRCPRLLWLPHATRGGPDLARTARQSLRPDPRGALRRSGASADNGVPARAAARLRGLGAVNDYWRLMLNPEDTTPRRGAARPASSGRSPRPRHGSRESRSGRKPGSTSAARTARACCCAGFAGNISRRPATASAFTIRCSSRSSWIRRSATRISGWACITTTPPSRRARRASSAC